MDILLFVVANVIHGTSVGVGFSYSDTTSNYCSEQCKKFLHFSDKLAGKIPHSTNRAISTLWERVMQDITILGNNKVINQTVVNFEASRFVNNQLFSFL